MKSHIDYNVPIVNKSNLPNYPVPNMVETFDRFLEWVKPLISQNEYHEASNLVKSFINSDESKKLDKKIKDLGNKMNDSWIFDYWVKFHLKVRDPIVPYTNVPIVYENLEIKDFTVLEKAAALAYGVANVYCDFKKHDSGEYYIGKKRYSSDQFHGVLGSINHIQRNMDKYYINSELSTNIIVIYRNHIYSLEVIKNIDEVYSIGDIYNSIKEIYKQNKTPIIPNINFVTSEPNRDLAGDYLLEILKNTENLENYQKIKDSIFVINLDENNPKTSIEELYSACMDIENFNRWHGKGLEISISENGVISFIVDHSFSDGGTEVYLIDQLSKYMKNLEFVNTENKVSYDELIFNLDNKISLNLVKSFEDYKGSMDCFTARYLEFEDISREKLKSYGILSGDGFIHIAMQLAQMMTYNKVYNTYIPVDVRSFFKGRTEVNRPITKESLEFVKEVLNSKKNKVEQKKMLLEALNVHHRRTKLCQQGKGVNRYLYVLEQILNDYKDELDIKQVPLIFESNAYKTIHYNRLSTTSFGHDDIKYVYFPPVTDGGFGIYYMIGNKSFIFITSFNEDIEMMDKFNNNLRYCVNKMMDIASAKI